MKRRWFVGLGGVCLLTSSAWAGPPLAVTHHPSPPGSCLPAPAPVPPCLPGASAPIAPAQPPTPGAPATPTTPTQPPTPAPSDTPTPSTDPGGAAAERGASGYSAYSPNLFGDAFGGPAPTVKLRVPVVAAATLGGLVRQSNLVDPAVFAIAGNPSVPTFLTPPGTVIQGRTITENYVASGPLQAGGGRSVYPLLENSQDRAATLAFAQRTFSGQTIRLEYLSDVASSAATPVPGGATIETRYRYAYLPTDPINIQVPSPTSPGFPGSTKIADDNSPLPRDRVILNYDYFNSVQLSMRGVPVHRISPGFEKTFLDQNASIEVRLPFASTLTSDLLAEGITSNTNAELGNLNITLKALLYGDEAVNVAAGLGIAVPTADPARVFTRDGVEVFRIENDTVVLTPYVALLLTPSRNLFIQNWVACAFNTIGNQVLSNPDFTGLQKAGRLFDQHQLQIDAQVGYWLLYPDQSDRYLQGLAPFVEIHWNSNISTAPNLETEQFSLTTANPRFNELNVSLGALFQVGNAVNLALGATFPTLNNLNRVFDYQLGVRCSVFFGPTLRTRTAATGVSAF